jgi:hypothetical protein
MDIFRAFFEVREDRDCVARFPKKGAIYFKKQGAVALDYKRIIRIHERWENNLCRSAITGICSVIDS